MSGIGGADGGKVWGYKPKEDTPTITSSSPSNESIGYIFIYSLFGIIFISMILYTYIKVYDVSTTGSAIAFTTFLGTASLITLALLIKESKKVNFSLIKASMFWLLFFGAIFYLAHTWFQKDLEYMARIDERQQTIQEEYGYTNVRFESDWVEKSKVEAINADGEDIEVNVIKYREFIVLFETEEQLAEKIKEINDGTYPEVLR